MRALGLLLLAVVVSGCGGASVEAERTPRPTERPRATPPQDALAQMALVFEGGYSEAEIKGKLDRSLADFGLEPNEANYRRAGDVLVSLANHNADEAGCPSCTEMAILDYMIATGPLDGMEWHQAAAWASSFLVAESAP